VAESSLALQCVSDRLEEASVVLRGLEGQLGLLHQTHGEAIRHEAEYQAAAEKASQFASAMAGELAALRPTIVDSRGLDDSYTEVMGDQMERTHAAWARRDMAWLAAQEARERLRGLGIATSHLMAQRDGLAAKVSALSKALVSSGRDSGRAGL